MRQLLIILAVMPFAGFGQTTNYAWSSVSLRMKSNNKTMEIAPIVRHNIDDATYQNVSVDLILKFDLKRGWYARMTTRTWLLPNGNYRQFFWPEVGHSLKREKYKLTNRLRWHYAHDIQDRFDADFLRWQTTLVPTVAWKVKPFVAVEPWFQFNDYDKFTRFRLEPGVNIGLVDRLNLTVMYRAQFDFPEGDTRSQNHWCTTLTCQL